MKNNGNCRKIKEIKKGLLHMHWDSLECTFAM